jgi:putative aldouronate transport system permease protein
MMNMLQTAYMQRIWRYRMYYLMALPGIIYFLVYKYFPMYGMIIAFKDFSIPDGIFASPWADPWYKHFKFFFDSPYFSQLMGNTILISLYKLFWGMAPSILFAIALYECRHMFLKRITQTFSYMPHFLSWVIIYGIGLVFLSEADGLINRWLTDFGFSSVPFLTSNEIFRSVLVGTSMWKDLGWEAIIYLAAMSSIDPSLYEAARVDGANRMRMIWHITLPGIRAIVIMLLILKLGHVMDAGFEQIYIMYNITVYPVADILDTWVYRTGLEQLNFSLASAVGFFKSIIGFALVIMTNQMAKKWGHNIW